MLRACLSGGTSSSERSALAGRGPFFAGKMHGMFIKHCNLQHLDPEGAGWQLFFVLNSPDERWQNGAKND